MGISSGKDIDTSLNFLVKQNRGHDFGISSPINHSNSVWQVGSSGSRNGSQNDSNALRCIKTTWESDIFANIDKIHKITVPSLVMHGTRDCIVPHYHGRYLAENLKNAVEPLWLPRAHNNLWDG